MSDSVVHAVAGAAGGMLAMTATYPLILISTRDAVRSKKSDATMLDTVQKIIKQEGVPGLYSGLSSSLFGIAVTNAIFYLFFEESKTVILRSKYRSASSKPGIITTAETMLSSVIAGSATTILTNPIWLIQTRQATAASTSPDGKKTQLGAFEALQLIIKEGGVGALWKGIGPSLVLVVNPVLQYTAFEQFANILSGYRAKRAAGAASGVSALAPRKLLSDLDMFYLGALSKLLATGITYPYLVVKSRLHASTHQYASSWQAIMTIFREEGFEGLYKGFAPKISQSVLTASLLFVAQRRVFELVKLLMTMRLARIARLAKA